MTENIEYHTITDMGVITSQQLLRYYELFKNIDVTFTKDIITLTGLQVNQTFLKCIGDQWPCVLYSSSFSQAKLIVTKSPVLMEKIAKAKNTVSLRLAFQPPGGKASNAFRSFIINGKVSGFSQYAKKPDELQIVTIQFTQQPPDDYIEVVGNILDAHVNAARRRDDRILLSVEAIRTIKLLRKETVVQINNQALKCIIRDISFSGAKIIVVGTADSYLHAPATLYLDFDDPRERVQLTGTIVRHEDVVDRANMVALGIHFDESKIPLSYKMHINLYIAANLQPQTSTGTKLKTAEKSQSQTAGQVLPEASKPVQNKEQSEKPANDLSDSSTTLQQ